MDNDTNADAYYTDGNGTDEELDLSFLDDNDESKE